MMALGIDGPYSDLMRGTKVKIAAKSLVCPATPTLPGDGQEAALLSIEPSIAVHIYRSTLPSTLD